MAERLKKYNEESYVHFITTVTFRRQPYFKDQKICQILAENIRFYQRKFDVEVYGWVVMPNHLHVLVWWDVEKQPNLTISKIIHGIKSHSAKQISENLLGRSDAVAIYMSGRSGATARPGLSSQGTGALATLEGVGRMGAAEKYMGREGASARPKALSHDAGAVATRKIKRLKIWHPGFYDFNIYSEAKLQEKIDYLKNNVIQAGLADGWSDYQWIYLKYQ